VIQLVRSILTAWPPFGYTETVVSPTLVRRGVPSDDSYVRRSSGSTQTLVRRPTDDTEELIRR
jgi:hypothetical protein